MPKFMMLIRGLPGSGKTTLAKFLTENIGYLDAFHVCADYYFDIFNDGKFDPKQIKDAHEWCRFETERHMITGCNVIVHNTFTREWEMEAYKKMAEEKGYVVFQVIAENHHNGKSEHNVPDDKIQQMKDRFEINL